MKNGRSVDSAVLFSSGCWRCSGDDQGVDQFGSAVPPLAVEFDVDANDWGELSLFAIDAKSIHVEATRRALLRATRIEARFDPEMAVGGFDGTLLDEQVGTVTVEVLGHLESDGLGFESVAKEKRDPQCAASIVEVGLIDHGCLRKNGVGRPEESKPNEINLLQNYLFVKNN